MIKNLIVRQDGSEIDSASILGFEYIKSVNKGKNLTVGSINSSSINVTIRNMDNVIATGEKLTYYTVEDNTREKIGEFVAGEPKIVSRNSYNVVAFDNISKLEKNLSPWLMSVQEQFPMSLSDLADKVCSQCGVTFDGGNAANLSKTVNAFYADDITGRHIIGWISEIAGRFTECDENGVVCLKWYRQSPVEEVNTSMYKQGSMTKQTYSTSKIKRVQIKQSDKDIGTIYPPTATGNTYAVANNMLISYMEDEDVTEIAQSLYNKLKDVTYVPCEFQVSRVYDIKPGEILNVKDHNGDVIRTFIMSMQIRNSTAAYASTGDKSYASSKAVASSQFKNTEGKVLSITADVNGLKIENKDLQGKYSEIKSSTDGLLTRVGKVEENQITDADVDEKLANERVSISSEIKQTAENVSIKFTQLPENVRDTTTDYPNFKDKYEKSIVLGTNPAIKIQTNNGLGITLEIDNETGFVFKKGDVAFGTWDGHVFHTGSIEIDLDQRARFGNFAFVPRRDGSLSFFKVGDD